MRAFLQRFLFALCTLIAALCLALAAGLFSKAPEPLMLRPVPAFIAGTKEPGQGIAINRADKETLDTLPGISPKIAGLIIEARQIRPFFYVEDLKIIPGIGDKRVEQLRPLVSME
jgi:DNA uptake protein ComE-like DNA-binding protein